MKRFIRRLYIQDEYERERLRDRLNALGFYVLRIDRGIEIYAIEDLRPIEDQIWEWICVLGASVWNTLNSPMKTGKKALSMTRTTYDY
jgi:hypothetical protein